MTINIYRNKSKIYNFSVFITIQTGIFSKVGTQSILIKHGLKHPGTNEMKNYRKKYLLITLSAVDTIHTHTGTLKSLHSLLCIGTSKQIKLQKYKGKRMYHKLFKFILKRNMKELEALNCTLYLLVLLINQLSILIMKSQRRQHNMAYGICNKEL